MKLNYKFASFLGAPIYINIAAALCFPYFIIKSDLLSGVISGICFLLLMLAHEMGHAWFVKKYNHDLVRINLFPIHGTCEYEFDPRYEPETLVYAGGLIVQVALFITFITLFYLLNLFGFWYVEELLEPVGMIFIQTNFILIIVNSLPIPGLDGEMLWKRLGEYIRYRLTNFNMHNLIKRKKKPIMSAEKIVDIAIQRAKRK